MQKALRNKTNKVNYEKLEKSVYHLKRQYENFLTQIKDFIQDVKEIYKIINPDNSFKL